MKTNMKKLRIMWLFPHLTICGGGTRYILEGLQEFAKYHDVHLYVQKSSPKILQQFLDASIKVTTMSKSSTGDVKFWLNFSNQIDHEIKFLKNEAKNYDIVISCMFPMNIVANSIALPHIQGLFQPFAFFWDPTMISKLPITYRIFLYFLKRKFGNLDVLATQNSNKLTTVISSNIIPISKIYHRNDAIIASAGVNTSFFKKSYESNLFKKYFGKKIILHSTDWTPLKRTNWLIDEFEKVSSKIENVTLLIMEVIDKGRERNIALKKIKERNIQNIEFLGLVDEKLLPFYYSLADVTIYSGVGGAASASYIVLESLACETPVIRTDFTHDEVEHNKTGFLFKPYDSDNFQNYVIELLKNDELNSQFGKNGRLFVEKNRSWKTFVEIYEKIFNEIIR